MQNFPKVLSRTDIHERLAVPCVAVQSLLPFNEPRHKFRFLVYDVSGNVWLMECTIRKQKGRGYPKPELTAGWLDFVRCKGLKVGDKVTFRKQRRATGHTPVYSIEVERSIKLFGKIIKAPIV